MAKLIVGCGYLGARVGQWWLAGGEDVFAITRSPLRANELASKGLTPIVADITARSPLKLPRQIDTVLFAVGYDRAGGASMHEVYVEGLAHVLDTLPRAVERLIYISSTGVYGQQERERVDESSPCRPDRPGGQICLEAENLLRSHSLGPRSLVLRLAGIYGPGRIPRRAEIEAAVPIATPGEGIMNLIHVDDAASIVVQLAAAAAPPELFCVSDGTPVARREYYRHLADLLGAPEPTFVAPPRRFAGRAASTQ